MNNEQFQKNIAAQVDNNSTGWVGILPAGIEHRVLGQTFTAANSGDLEEIQVMPTLVAGDCRLSLRIYRFDSSAGNWGEELGASTINLHNGDAGHWVSFRLPGLHVNKGETYGFLVDSNDSYVGLAEACASATRPALSSGKEWKFYDGNPEGNCFSYYSLAFCVKAAA